MTEKEIKQSLEEPLLPKKPQAAANQMKGLPNFNEVPTY